MNGIRSRGSVGPVHCGTVPVDCLQISSQAQPKTRSIMMARTLLRQDQAHLVHPIPGRRFRASVPVVARRAQWPDSRRARGRSRSDFRDTWGRERRENHRQLFTREDLPRLPAGCSTTSVIAGRVLARMRTSRNGVLRVLQACSREGTRPGSTVNAFRFRDMWRPRRFRRPRPPARCPRQ